MTNVMTNADYIKAMHTDTLALFLYGISNSDEKQLDKIAAWLKAPLTDKMVQIMADGLKEVTNA